MIYRVRHTTTYDYHESVSLSQHVLRLRPRDSARQSCLDYHVSVSPAPRSQDSHTDYFGNAVSFVAVEQPHTRLTINAVSKVRKTRVRAPDPLENTLVGTGPRAQPRLPDRPRPGCERVPFRFAVDQSG